MKIHTYGADARLGFCRDHLMREGDICRGKIMLLPIPTTRDGKSLHGCKLTLCELASECEAGDVVVGYAMPKEFRADIASRGAVAIDVSRDEDYITENAELTAVGVVGRILTDGGVAPCGLSIGVIGYGRIGQRLVRILMFLSGRVVVFTSKAELREELCMLGVSNVDSASIDSEIAHDKLAGLDILINTAPARLIGDGAVKALSGVRVIELASGDNMPEGLVAERFASVPAVMYPASAGAALARSVLRMLGASPKKYQ